MDSLESGSAESSEASESQESNEQHEDGSERQEPTPAEKRMLRAKVNGQEIEVSEEDILRDYQKYKAADSKLKEAATMKKQLEGFVSYLKENPKEGLKQLGVDPRKFSEDTLLAYLEDEMMDPKDKELKTTKQRLAELEAKENEEKERMKEAEMAQLEKQYADSYSNSIIAALDAENIPRTPFTIRRMASYMAEGLKRGVDLSPADVVRQVKKDYSEDYATIFKGMNPEDIISIFGDDLIKKIRKYDTQRTQTKPGFKPVSGDEPRSKPSKKIGIEQWRERNRRILEGLE